MNDEIKKRILHAESIPLNSRDQLYEKARELSNIFESLANSELISLIREYFANTSDEFLHGFLEHSLIPEVCNGAPLLVTMACLALCRRCGCVDKVFELLRPTNFLTMDDQIVVNDACLEKLYVAGACLKGGWIDPNDPARVHCCCCKRSPRGLSVQLQAKYRDFLKCVHVVVHQVGNDVVARADWAAYTMADREVGYDFESDGSIANDPHVQVATSEDSDGYGVSKLFIWATPGIDPLKVDNFPVWVYKGGYTGWHETGYMGNEAALRIDDHFKRSMFSSVCVKVEYVTNDDWGGFYWCDHAYPEFYFHAPRGSEHYLGGANLTHANALLFRARGEKGGEKVSFFIGQYKGNIPDTADRLIEDVILTRKWRTYRIDLDGLDLSRVITGFGFWVRGQGRPITFYVNRISYEHMFWRKSFFGGNVLKSYSISHGDNTFCCDRNGMRVPKDKNSL